MGRSVNISTEIPAPASMLKRLGISKARQAELSQRVEEKWNNLRAAEAEKNGAQIRTVSISSPPVGDGERGKKRKLASASN